MKVAKIFGVVLIVVGALGLWLSVRRDRPDVLPSSIGTFPGASVVMVTIDTTRADRLGCYGSNAGLTPNLDHLAEEGILFEQAQTVAPITLPSHTTMMTGLTPIKHGVRNNGMFVLPDNIETLAEVFSEDGYATGAFVSAQVLVRRYGLNKGFDVYGDDLSKSKKVGRALVPSRRGDITLGEAMDWLKSIPAEKPVFLWVHLYDPHAPYDPPPEFRSRFPSDPYGGEIAFADSLVGNLIVDLKEFGRWDNTVLTVLSDHGEALGEHGERSHGMLIHQATIHVPWIVRTPGSKKAIRVHQPVSTVDLAPLLTSLVNVRLPNRDQTDGRLPFGQTASDQEERAIYFETLLPMYQYGWAALRGLREGDWTLETGTRDELFNLRTDPRELINVAETSTLEVKNLKQGLDEFVKNDTKLDAKVPLQLAPSDRDALEALGYLATTAPPRRIPPDPRDLVSGHVQVERSLNLMAAGMLDEALSALDMMLEKDPQNIAALSEKARVYMMKGDLDKAEATYRNCLTLDPQNSDTISGLCQVEMVRRNFEKVIQLAKIGRESRSPFHVFDAFEARALIALGRTDEATALIDKKIADSPDSVDLLSVHATLLLKQGKTAEAEADLRKAVAIDPFNPKVRRQLGELLKKEGRGDEAVEVFKQLLQIQADDPDTLLSIGSLLLDSDPVAALPYLEEASRLAPGRSSCLTSLAVAYLKVGRMTEAESVLRRAIEINPDEPSAYSNLGIILTKTGRYKEAIKVLSDLLERVPSFYMGRNNLAIALAENGDLAAAKKEVQQVLKTHPEYTDGLLTLSGIYERQGRPDDVYEILKKTAKTAPDRLDVRLRLGLAAARVGHCDHTLQLFANMLDNPTAFPAELNLAIAKCLEQEGRLSLALSHFEQAARKGSAGEIRDQAQAGIQRLGLKLRTDK